MNENFKKIRDIFPLALEKTVAIKEGKENLETGIYTNISSNGYQLWSLNDFTFIIENPNSKSRDAVFPPHPESVYMTNLIPKTTSNKNFLDVGVGSGILSIFAAKNGWNVTGIDINEKAIKNATINSLLNNVVCNFEEADITNSHFNNKFDFCIANLPFEPTPMEARNFIHSDGGIYGDDLVNKFINSIDSVLANNGICILPSFSLIKENVSRKEEYLSRIDNKKFSSVILRISKNIPLSFLSTRFFNDKTAYGYLEAENYKNFSIDIAIFKKQKNVGSFLGVTEIEIADEFWIMPSGWKGISQCE